MTVTAGTPRRRRPSTKRMTLRLLGASLIASGAIAGGLAIQMAAGHDPALGAGTSSAQTTSGSGSASATTSGEVGQAQDRSGQFGQSASPPASVTTRSS
jgi:hypothetical protein